MKLGSSIVVLISNEQNNNKRCLLYLESSGKFLKKFQDILSSFLTKQKKEAQVNFKQILTSSDRD